MADVEMILCRVACIVNWDTEKNCCAAPHSETYSAYIYLIQLQPSRFDNRTSRIAILVLFWYF